MRPLPKIDDGEHNETHLGKRAAWLPACDCASTRATFIGEYLLSASCGACIALLDSNQYLKKDELSSPSAFRTVPDL
jgi:hypothetical protein